MRLPQELIDHIMILNDDFYKCIGISHKAARVILNKTEFNIEAIIKNSNLRTLKWIIKNHKFEKCIIGYDNATKAINRFRNATKVWKFCNKNTIFNKNKHIGICSLIYYASKYGKIDMIKWLLRRYPECFTSRVIDIADKENHVELVNFYHDVYPDQFYFDYVKRQY